MKNSAFLVVNCVKTVNENSGFSITYMRIRKI